MSGDFYRAFEDRYRGSREMIKERLRAYMPFVAPLAPASAPEDDAAPLALDLGCGRGEWLELLGENGFAARGVDLDDGMLAACRERGLSVDTADALSSLQALADNSVAVVSAFHLVEHLSFDTVQALVAQALRVLQPGGLLIMETPNPENPMVGACRFYLDPSHERPLPPNLLSFLTEHAGFARNKVVRLQEDPLLHTAAVRLIDVLDGASPDYGVVAQKTAAAEVLEPFDAPLQRAFGIGIGELAQRFEESQQAAIGVLVAAQQRHEGELARVETGLQQRTDAADARLAETNARADEDRATLADIRVLLTRVDLNASDLSSRMSRTDLLLARYETRLVESHLRITEVQTQLANAHAQQDRQWNALSDELRALRMHLTDAESARVGKERELEELRSHVTRAELHLTEKEHELAASQGKLDAILHSTSWRITAPLRWIGSLFGSAR